MNTSPTPNGSSRSSRLRRRKIKRIILFASLLVVIALLAVASVLLALEISKASDRSNTKTTSEPDVTSLTPPDTTLPDDGDYTAFMVDSKKYYEGSLVLVNKDHEYTFPMITLSDMRSSRTQNADGNYSYGLSVYSMQLESEALSAFNQMMNAFYIGTKCESALVNAAYRTSEEQDAVGSDIKGGFSDHNTGLLVSLRFYLDGKSYSPADSKFSAEYDWLAEHCHEYGFIVRYPDDKSAKTGVSGYSYAYRYVGKVHAAYMKENNLCLEEYIELLKSYTVDGAHLLAKDVSGKSYEIYRIPVSNAEKTSVKIPEGKQYEISGDNDGGLIITVSSN